MAKKAILIGKISRIAKLCGSDRTELTIDVRETTIDGSLFAFGTQVSCTVSNTIARDVETKRISALSIGDNVTIEAEKLDHMGWTITALSHHHPTICPFADYLNNLEEELAKRNK
ncbi:MAG: hypothetical protein J6Y53_02715 [Alphaproteobacteria bacterium]|nr:hypothetical protein [Alphaproteobacteria bacterium]